MAIQLPRPAASVAPDLASSPGETIGGLRARMQGCRLCAVAPLGTPLPVEPRPIFVLSDTARLVIASQAPGFRAFTSGVPFQDPSGERLRNWLGLDEKAFYDASRLMILPMGFCFPGHDAARGDLPPRPECRLAWHDHVFASLPQVETILCVGLHAIRYHLARLHPAVPRNRSLTAMVEDWASIAALVPGPRLIPLPHPSWRNTAWLKRHPFFERELLPALRAEVRRLVLDAT